jgi:hypothetical protein
MTGGGFVLLEFGVTPFGGLAGDTDRGGTPGTYVTAGWWCRVTAVIGGQVLLPFGLNDGNGDPVDASYSQITITQPDGSTVTLTPGLGITRSDVGRYVGVFVPTQAGRHTWSGYTVPESAFAPDAFNVASGSDAPLVGLAEARAWLGIDVPDHDPLIRRATSRATEVAEWWTGETLRRTVVTAETHHQRGVGAVQLWQVPVQAVTGVSDNGAALTGGAGVDWTLDEASGLLYRGSRAGAGQWSGPVQVTYVAGYSVVPDRYLGGVEELTRHLFGQLQDGRDEDYAYTQDAQVRAICALHLGSRVGGFA